MNIPSDDLFQLIQSLTKAEKKNFKHFASKQRGEKNYMRLFDAIDRQKEYNEAAIKKIFHDKKFIRQLNSIKNYLYHLISKSLESHHYSLDSQLKSNLHRIEIFFEKGLYSHCRKILIKTKEIAKKYEKHLVLIELSGWEFELLRAQSYQGKTKKETERFYKDAFRATAQYVNYKEYEQLSARMFSQIYNKGSARTDVDSKLYQEIINHPLLKAENKTMSYQALSRYYTIYSVYYLMKNDFTSAYSSIKKLVKLMEEHPHQMEERLQDYVAMSYNLITCQLNLKKYNEVMLTLQKLKAINTKSKYIKSRIFYTVNDTALNMCVNSGEFEKGIKYIKPVLEEIDKVGLSKNDKMFLYFSIFNIYFGTGNYSSANTFLSKIINDATTDVRSDLYCMARIMLLIVHYELGHEELLEYMEKSAHRYLDKKERLYKVESSILDFMRRKVPEIIATQDKIKAFNELKSELEKITKDPFEKKALEYFDFISWLESKIESKPFAEIIKEKAPR